VNPNKTMNIMDFSHITL